MFIQRLILRTYPGCYHNIMKRGSSTHIQQVQPDLQQNESQPYKLDPFSSITDNKSDHRVYMDNLKPPIKRSFNLAAFVNHSETLQKLVKLGVSLFDIESINGDAAQYYVTLDFERDCLQHVKFLLEKGLKEKNIGRFISEFPLVFKENIDDLQTRINYFESKGFSSRQISCILNRTSLVLSHKTKTIDHKLGQLQLEFKLPSTAIRKIVTLHPRLILIPSGQYKLTSFTLSEEFGFRTREIIEILEKQPGIIEIPRPTLIQRLDLVHNTMGFSHQIITRFPKLITGPHLDIRHRHTYLKKLGRNQYDETRPLYVPPSALYNVTDEIFCTKYAKTNLDDYKYFIRFM